MRSVPVPGEAFAADADAVAHRLAVAEHEIEVGVRRIDDDACRPARGSGSRPSGDANCPAAPSVRRSPADSRAAARRRWFAVVRSDGGRRLHRRALRIGRLRKARRRRRIRARPAIEIEDRPLLRRRDIGREGASAEARIRRRAIRPRARTIPIGNPIGFLPRRARRPVRAAESVVRPAGRHSAAAAAGHRGRAHWPTNGHMVRAGPARTARRRPDRRRAAVAVRYGAGNPGGGGG